MPQVFASTSAATSRRLTVSCAVAAAALLPFLLTSKAVASHDDRDNQGSYSYVRAVEGSAELVTADGSREEAALHQPVLPGDELRVGRSGRIEVVLSDGSIARLDAGTDVRFESLADSYGSSGRQTRLHLTEGALQLVVEGFGRQQLPRIDTQNVTVHLQEAGAYLIVAEAEGWTQVVTRRGFAEVVTERGSLVVRENEQALVEGDRWPRSSVESAERYTDLERWGERLEEEARYASVEELDPSLRYASATMGRHGSWVQVSGHRRAWRPYVDAGWSPYRQGFWRYTPGGYTWVAEEPWGWVPYHYGTWDYVPGQGWVWFPDRAFAPAWVYWYWGTDYVGWCPTGYYSRYYNDRYGWGHSYGVHGWVGGDWGQYAHWSFTPSHHFGRHGQARRTRPSYLRGSDLRGGRLEGGVLTTDTRGLSPELLEKPGEATRLLRTRPGVGSNLPDLTDFVARRELSPEIERQIARPRPEMQRPTGPAPGSDRPEVVVVDEKPGREDRPSAVRPRPTVPTESDWREPRSPEKPKPEIVRRPADYGSGDPQVGRDDKPRVREGRPDRPTLSTNDGGGSAPVLRPVPQVDKPDRPVRVAPPSPRPAPQATPERPPQPRPLPPAPETKPKGDGGGERKVGSTRPPRPPKN